MKLLVVDPDPHFTEWAEKHFEDAIELFIANSPEDAMSLLARYAGITHALVAQQILSGDSSLYEEISRLFPNIRILITSFSEFSAFQKLSARANGAHYFLTKPINPVHLRLVLQELKPL